jgi:hypothetical protein
MSRRAHIRLDDPLEAPCSRLRTASGRLRCHDPRRPRQPHDATDRPPMSILRYPLFGSSVRALNACSQMPFLAQREAGSARAGRPSGRQDAAVGRLGICWRRQASRVAPKNAAITSCRALVSTYHFVFFLHSLPAYFFQQKPVPTGLLTRLPGTVIIRLRTITGDRHAARIPS